jgi:hypothetical protein
MKVTKKVKSEPPKSTKPEVFIIESLEFVDEENQRFEGRILFDILRMCGKNPKYFYFRTEEELVELVTKFDNSGYRYLHISAHGNEAAIGTTLGSITYLRFADIFEGHLNKRRIFLSACSVGNDQLATRLKQLNKTLYSFAAPVNDIEFHTAAALWGALYVLLFNVDDSVVKSRDLTTVLTKVCGLFGVRFFLGRFDDSQDRWVKGIIGPKK